MKRLTKIQKRALLVLYEEFVLNEDRPSHIWYNHFRRAGSKCPDLTMASFIRHGWIEKKGNRFAMSEKGREAARSLLPKLKAILMEAEHEEDPS